MALMHLVNNRHLRAKGKRFYRPWMLPIYTKTNGTAASSTNIANGEVETAESIEAKREHSVKDLTQKLANQSLLTSPVDENKSLLRSGELSGTYIWKHLC